MKFSHKIAFIIVVVFACFSAYSLAEINETVKLGYSWFDGVNFRNENRDYTKHNKLTIYPEYMDFDILTDTDKIITVNGSSSIKNISIPSFDEEKQFLIFATLGEVEWDKASIKVSEICQRGNVVEVLMDVNNEINSEYKALENIYPYEFVKIDRDDLIIQGDTLFIFKDYSGKELYRKSCQIFNKVNTN